MSLPEVIRLRLEVEELCYDYVEALDGGELERWPEFFTDDCFYQVISRENYDQGLPLATIRCESKGMLADRVVALRDTMMFAPQHARHLVSNIRVRKERDGVIPVTSNYAVLQTLMDEETKVFSAGRYLDEVVRRNGVLRFARKICVYDSGMVPNSLIYPI